MIYMHAYSAGISHVAHQVNSAHVDTTRMETGTS